ncbi:hypothetical protein WJX74_007355 [Apatococcus lobatus]|uniref:Uncharacterized protein n=1 Tax=Apatococcus lobatus TaxID=904363 RepID=A0AAW1QB69_9CHLO
MEDIWADGMDPDDGHAEGPMQQFWSDSMEPVAPQEMEVMPPLVSPVGQEGEPISCVYKDELLEHVSGALMEAGDSDLHQECLIRRQGPRPLPDWERFKRCHDVDVQSRDIWVDGAVAGVLLVLCQAHSALWTLSALQDINTFEAALQQVATEHVGVMPLVIAGFAKPPCSGVDPKIHGSGTLLSPPVRGDDGEWTVAVATALHVVSHWTPIRTKDLLDAADFIPKDVAKTAGLQGEWKLVAEPRAATSQRKAIVAQRPAWQKELDLLIFTAAVPKGAAGQVFPFKALQGWDLTMRKALVVPTRPLPPTDGTPSLLLVGTPVEPIVLTGNIPDVVLQQRHGISTDRGPGTDAEKIERDIMRTHKGVVSVGDVVAANNIFICHRCSAGYGMSGGPATSISKPGLLHGVQLSSAGKPWQYNLLYGVNHPGFILQYGIKVVPLLSKCPAVEYPAKHMLSAIQDYLEYHQDLLGIAGCTQDAELICSL